MAAVLQLVQRDVRYLGIEVGPGSHAPTAPDKVYQRRFGDCKDKATLIITMLSALEIPAFPVLIDAQTERGFKQYLKRALAEGCSPITTATSLATSYVAGNKAARAEAEAKALAAAYPTKKTVEPAR